MHRVITRSLVLAFFAGALCQNTHSAERCTEKDHYKHGVTPLEGNVRGTDYLCEKLLGDFSQFHEALKDSVLRSTSDVHLRIAKKRDQMREERVLRKQDLDAGKEGESAAAQMPPAHGDKKPNGFPNFVAVGVSFFYEHPETGVSERRDVHLRKKHVLRALEEEKMKDEQRDEIVHILSGGRQLAPEDIFTFISGPLRNAGKQSLAVSKRGVKWFTDNASANSKCEEDLYEQFFLYTVGYEINWACPSSLDSERYAFWALNHKTVLEDLRREAERGITPGFMVTGFIHHLHTWLDMCRNCLRIQNVYSFMSNKVSKKHLGFMSLLRDILRERNMREGSQDSAAAATPPFPRCTAIVSSSQRHSGANVSSPASRQLFPGSFWDFNVHQYMYPEDHNSSLSSGQNSASAAAADSSFFSSTTSTNPEDQALLPLSFLTKSPQISPEGTTEQNQISQVLAPSFEENSFSEKNS